MAGESGLTWAVSRALAEIIEANSYDGKQFNIQFQLNKVISISFIVFALSIQVKAQNPLPKVVQGKIERKVDSLMIIKGYNENNWITYYSHGDDHSEKSWNKRLNVPLEFLFKK